MLVACGKPSSQKTFENFFKEFQNDLIKREEGSVEPFKTILKISEKTTYKINKVEEKGDNSELNVTIKAVNLGKYTDELSAHLEATASAELTEEEINQKAVDYFTELLKSEKKLEFTETNIQVQMKKISGKWNILNTDDIYTAIAGNPVTVEIVP
ncbi:DUF5105 domain-containing protein [Fusobacterium nucleatum subsp. nucleatum ATCC 25586]|uniref:DUF5105 domain-containing protein n=2 Tax=Fusobacterium nucleatum TaxID=851 RepID=Q8RFK5_FUSNN|nr:Hypothetical protein FN0690 [Fusobacterium nucleatum subsp. nucleatum ATCC 25586]AVQ15952.1 DUF5105 domain-containing protein [Fusobacterium nucleatum subsp. nucleatum ATCC 25586]